MSAVRRGQNPECVTDSVNQPLQRQSDEKGHNDRNNRYFANDRKYIPPFQETISPSPEYDMEKRLARLAKQVEAGHRRATEVAKNIPAGLEPNTEKEGWTAC